MTGNPVFECHVGHTQTNLTRSKQTLVVKVDGNIPGNSFKATGSNNSMNGTMMKTENGTRRNKSDVVLTNCLLSRLHEGKKKVDK